MTAALTRYGAELRVQLGIGRQDQRGVWDTGAWGTSMWGESDTALGDWVDVTCDVEDPFTLAAGASDAEGVVTRWEAASLRMTLWGNDYDPWGGPWAGIIGPGIGVRVLWRPLGELVDIAEPPLVAEPVLDDWRCAFLGRVAASGWEWRPSGQQTPSSVVSATDTTQTLVAYDAVAGTLAGAGDTAAQRVARILNMAYWPAAGRDIGAGGTIMRATELEGVAWDQLLVVADTDLALLWVNRAGVLAYRPSGRVGEGTRLAARLVVCDEPGNPEDVAVVTMGGTQFGDVRNVVSISHVREEGTPEPPVTTAIDDSSIARYGRRAYARTDLMYADSEEWWAGYIAGAVLAASAWPSPAPRFAELDSRMGNPIVPLLLLGLEPDMTFDVMDTRGTVRRQSAIGWDVEVGASAIRGTVRLDDLSRWIAGEWDEAGWDVERWGFAIVGED